MLSIASLPEAVVCENAFWSPALREPGKKGLEKKVARKGWLSASSSASGDGISTAICVRAIEIIRFRRLQFEPPDVATIRYPISRTFLCSVPLRNRTPVIDLHPYSQNHAMTIIMLHILCHFVFSRQARAHCALYR